ncbi:MAG: hypothetical protein A2X61_16485 [Ignavibacteria bacterium GWB2_35_12]|nr:MAG: hypothetical protein A2X63_14240 [Ignavibacteria bacterium GWA2_35_8]OGU38127.1 MAG: hypothetical protein A2X61_16485 [Ignavibacteria bacterium GWB2_35_12]OGU87019.1 MAG: hypothetical protein A2220_05720 [Ignavibacteria bacterium RIFOXYA2_FULL_35_10]OGV24899.1 MAG: hypothetical protein A2475_16110 [Ignavibacteria bacterium RIFOXYC2_FULL_35_21]
MYRILIIICSLLIISLTEAKTVKFDIDGAQFRYDDSKVLWEMYYSFPDTLLKYQFKLKEGLYIGELYINVKIKSSVKIEAEKEWIVTNSSKFPLLEHKTDLLGQKDFLLSPGQYEVQIILLDSNDSTTNAEIKYNLIVNKFDANSLELSDLELSIAIENQDRISVRWNESFKKGNLYVIPNPSHLFFGDSLILNAYYETYNAPKISPSGFIIKYRILDALKREELSMTKVMQSISDAQSDFISLPINVLPTGVYFFETTLVYPMDNPKDSVSKSELFYVLNPEIPPNLQAHFSESVSFEKSEWAIMSNEQIVTEFEKVKCIASVNEIELWEELATIEAKQKFMFAFWNIRNSDTVKPYNEKLMEYRKLIDYANTYFSYGKMKDGWRSDRGKVLLKYGKPTQRDQTAARGDYRAYENWNYTDVQGGVNFYFVDLIGFGNFVLVHSTAIGEMRNENWYNQYVPARNEDDDIQYQQNYNPGIIK